MDISIHASAKEATRSGDDLLLCFPYFNPRLREGGDLNTGLPLMEQQKFQSTPPRRRRPSNILAAPAAQDYFNPRLREGGDIKMHLYVNHDGFQSTPPRRRRLCTISCTPATTRISTHASAKEATEVGMTYFSVFLISIHASAKEATRKYRRLLPDYDFNPRLREGGDLDGICVVTVGTTISIHASAKEATLSIAFLYQLM